MYAKNVKPGYLAIAGVIFFLLFSGTALAQESNIIISTNRFVILDDPSGWVNGWSGNSGVGNQWSGESTTIRWYVLLLNSSRGGSESITVTSTIIFPNGTVAVTKTNTTNSLGIAEFNQNMDNWLQSNGSVSEGIYTINSSATVNNTSVAAGYKFVYDEWGCGSSGTGCHNSQYWQSSAEKGPQNANKWASGSTQNSPYLHAWDNFHTSSGHGSKGNMVSGECLTCHRGYDGANRLHISRVTTTPQYSAGIHYGKTGAACTNCHTTFNSGNMPIKQCYDCHPKKNNNLTVKNFTQTATSGFSYRPLTSPNIKAHSSDQNIPCILCHSGMHNASMPYNITGTSNTYTDYQQCTFCHNAYNRHNDSVSCTVCHSQDAHAIKVLAQNATYVTGRANPVRGNCTNCHQNPAFQGNLESQPKAGNYSGRNPPLVPAPLNHSINSYSGALWNGAQPAYWDNTSQLNACNYCHGSVLHNSSALGNINKIKGTNNLNQSLEGSSWCANCHYKNAPDYAGNQLVPQPPEMLNLNGLVPATASDGTLFFNHSGLSNFNDSNCKGCHGSALSGYSETSLNLSHSVSEGGGDNCIDCHGTNYIGASPSVTQTFVNISAFNESIHQDINNTQPATLDNLDCWSCHYNKDMDRLNVKKCGDCHRKPSQWHGNADITTNLSELW